MNALTNDLTQQTDSTNSDDDGAGAVIRVLIADDHPLIIAGIRRTIEQSEDFEVVGEARSGGEFMTLIERRSPEIWCSSTLGCRGFRSRAHRAIRERWPDIKVVVLSACDDRPSIDGALNAGANAYMLKTTTPVDISVRPAPGCTGRGVPCPGSPADRRRP